MSADLAGLRPILTLSPAQQRQMDETGCCDAGNVHCPICFREVRTWGAGSGPVIRFVDGEPVRSRESWRRFEPCGCEGREAL